jgi:riboflavin kinase/FMN adenylyltransferase
MQVFHDLSHSISDFPTVLTIGAFDGVHLGHQQLIRSVVESARASNRRAALVTFFPLPSVVLGRAAPFYLTSNEEKLAQLERLGLDVVVIVEFTRETAQIRAAQFVNLLIENLRMREMWIGHDFALGYKREGNAEFLRAMGVERGAERGYAVHSFEPVMLDGQPVSSSRIRDALRAGDVRQANACLGRPFQLSGVVVQGAHRGRSLGVPTANLSVWAEHAVPANGIYACRVHVGGATASRDAVTNIGTRPTFDNGVRTIEAHLLDAKRDADLYGQTMALDFIAYQRPEVKYDSVEALVVQMQEDVRMAQEILAPSRKDVKE